MKPILFLLSIGLCLGLLTSSVASIPQISVWTHHNDNARSGANLSETVLNTTTVDPNRFGKLFSYPVDDDIYTQPLVVAGVSIAGKGTHNVVYVATQNDSVFAFDADNNSDSNAQPLWHVDLTGQKPGVTPVPVDEVAGGTSGNIRRPGNIGIMGTPVIDLLSNTMYLVARTKESGAYVQKLHALDIGSGREKFAGPVTIQASVPGNGDGSGTVTFDPKIQNQRAGLALANGNVYIAWGAHDDIGPYHGWLMSYDAATLQQLGVFCTTPDGQQTGIWQSGQPPSIDTAGNVFVMTGNGTFDGTRNFGESIVKLDSKLTAVLNWFAPDNWSDLNAADEDLGSAGVLLIPGTTSVIGGGKSGTFFLLDTANMGHTQVNNNQITQHFQATGGGHIHGGPVYWNSPAGGRMYVWGEKDTLKAFAFDGTRFNETPVSESTFNAPPGMPGGFLSISAAGRLAGSGIVWAALPALLDAENLVVSGVLRAFDASDLSHELWNSRANTARDDLGNFAKHVPPTIANGHVYMASFSNQLNVYGLLTAPTGTTLSLVSGTAGASVVGKTVMFSVTVSGNAPTGSITCSDNNSPFAQDVVLTNGGASCTASALTVGLHNIVAAYSGDANNAAASRSITQTVSASSPAAGGRGATEGGGGGAAGGGAAGGGAAGVGAAGVGAAGSGATGGGAIGGGAGGVGAVPVAGSGGGGGGCTVNHAGAFDGSLLVLFAAACLYMRRPKAAPASP